MYAFSYSFLLALVVKVKLLTDGGWALFLHGVTFTVAGHRCVLLFLVE